MGQTESEGEIKREILDYLALQTNCLVLPIFVGGVHGRKTPGRVGTPDIICCYRGSFIGIEVKSATGKQSPAQKQVGKEIEASGGQYIVARSIDDVIPFCK